MSNSGMIFLNKYRCLGFDKSELLLLCNVVNKYECSLFSFHHTRHDLPLQFPFIASGSMNWIMIDFAMKAAEDEKFLARKCGITMTADAAEFSWVVVKSAELSCQSCQGEWVKMR